MTESEMFVCSKLVALCRGRHQAPDPGLRHLPDHALQRPAPHRQHRADGHQVGTRAADAWIGNQAPVGINWHHQASFGATESVETEKQIL